MSLIIALILGVIQGLTEFFPISSSAHIEIAKNLLSNANTSIFFDLACHLGTLLALLWFFKNEIIIIMKTNKKKILYLFLALLPLVPSYFLFEKLLCFFSDPKYLGALIMTTGGILIAGQKIRVKKQGNIIRDLLLIGTIQTCALLPGISRSASTISCAKILGWSQTEAVRFSFLLAIPTIIGGTVIKIYKFINSGQLLNSIGMDCFVGFGAAAVTGFAIVHIAIRTLEKGSHTRFAWYCLILGALTQFTLNATT